MLVVYFGLKRRNKNKMMKTNKILNIALNKGSRISDRFYGRSDNRSIEVLMDEEQKSLRFYYTRRKS
jgi:hypothetical protein